MDTIKIEYTHCWEVGNNEVGKDVIVVQRDNNGDADAVVDMMASVMLAATFHPNTVIDAMEAYIDEHKEQKEDENV